MRKAAATCFGAKEEEHLSLYWASTIDNSGYTRISLQFFPRARITREQPCNDEWYEVEPRVHSGSVYGRPTVEKPYKGSIYGFFPPFLQLKHRASSYFRKALAFKLTSQAAFHRRRQMHIARLYNELAGVRTTPGACD